MHGKGVYTWPDGMTYDGEWKDGDMHGKGVRTWPDGQTYDGEWKADAKHGKGVYTWPDGTTYDGEWKDDKRHGKGVKTLPDGRKCESEWEDGEWQTDKWTQRELIVLKRKIAPLEQPEPEPLQKRTRLNSVTLNEDATESLSLFDDDDWHNTSDDNTSDDNTSDDEPFFFPRAC
jgi:hypothetical protein